MTTQRQGHGWWAYFLPFVGFMVVVEIGRKLPDGFDAYVQPVQVAVPLGFLLYYYARGHYPELRRYPFGAAGIALDFGVGLAGAALWMTPYLCFAWLRPDDPGFDPNQWGASFAFLALTVRGIGFGLVTPFMEELFVRSWLMRYVDVYNKPVDFRDVPIGRFRWPSFLVIVIYFTFSHVPWEWPVAFAWVSLTTLWLYYRKNLMSLVIVHAGSNLGILAFVMLQSGKWLDEEGNPLSLWFFL